MREEIYQQIYDRYLKKYWELHKEVKTNACRFTDIAANLLGCKINIKRNRKKFVEHIRALRDYFRLLDQYPKFKEDELSKLEGHFPEFGGAMNKLNFDYESEGFSGYLPHYVAYSKRKLEDIARSAK